VISYELYCQIQLYYKERGLSFAQIGRELNLDEETVAKWARQKTYCQHLRARRKSKLDPYKPIIQRWLEQHPYSAAQIFQRLRAEEAYSGGISILTDYVRRVRPVRAPAFLTLVFAPGECAQVDWGCAGAMAVGSTRRRLSFFVMVLCYSRLCYLEFSLGEATEHFLAAHQNALEFFGRVRPKLSSTILRPLCSSILLEKGRSFIRATWTLQHTTASSHVLVTCEGQTKKAVSNPVSGT
jgi:transposase